MPPAKRFKVAICGAGIGGLTAAVALSQYPDIDVEIFEGASKLAEVGAGIGIFPRPWEIIRRLGLEADLLKSTEIKPKEGPVTSFRYRKSDQPHGLDFYTLITQGNLMTFHRADFQQVLLKKIPRSYRIHCGKRLRSYSQRLNGSVDLLFEDGTTYSCDVLIGADGVKSAVRASLCGEKARWAQSEGRKAEAAAIMSCVEPEWSGTNAYRALIPAEKLRARYPNHRVFTQPTQYLGKGGHVIAYPISHGRLINFVAFKTQQHLEGTKFNGQWVCPGDISEFASSFQTWEPEVQALMDCVDKPLRWAIHTVKSLGSFVSGRVAVIGDAAHAHAPYQGSGAGQAIEDAYMIATVLGHPQTTRETLAHALSVYDHVRRPIAHNVHERARLNGQYFSLHFDGIDFDTLSGNQLRAKLQLLSQTFTKNWEWAWTTSIQSSVYDALRLLEPDSL
ncbi:hypothetical protein BDQ17DRAFT_1287752 [Cyathus striatus]|nr:hypothetical protein BDQ17DRAFT_1287752 [Cyathus striatus]